MAIHLIQGDPLAGSLTPPGSSGQLIWNNAGTLDATGAALTFNSGTSTTSATNLTVGTNLTLSGGTANGVLYLNGSKVASSGSAVSYDGTTFQINGKYFATTFNTSVVPNTGSGLAIAWNKTGGTGEVNFYNQYNGSGVAGGFDFWQGTGTNTYSRLGFLDCNSVLNLSGSSAGITLGGDWTLNRVGAADVTVVGRAYFNSGTWTSTSTSRSALQSGITLSPSGASSARVWGLFFGANGAGNQNITDGWALNGMEGNAGYSGSATCAGANGILAYCYNNGTGTMTDARGLNLIGMPDNAASGGHITNVYWLDVNPYAPAFSANNQKRIGINVSAMPSVGAFTGCVSAAVNISGTSRATRDGIVIGGDTYLYSSGAGTLRTDGILSVGSSLSVGTTATVTTSVTCPLLQASAAMTVRPSASAGAGFSLTVQGGTVSSLSAAAGGDLLLKASPAGGAVGNANGGSVKINAGLKVNSGTTGSILLYKSDASTKVVEVNDTGIGLYGTTPVAQYSTTGTTGTTAAGVGTAIKDDTTLTGGVGSTAYTLGDVIKALKSIGLMAS